MLRKLIKFAASNKAQMAIIASTAALCCGLTNTAQAIPFNEIRNIYFFGDSLTDSGFNNLFPGLPAGKAPTFTTYGGYTWSQYIAHDIKGYPLPTFPPGVADTITNNTTPLNTPGPVNPILTGIDYACGGSTTQSIPGVLPWAPTLLQQINHFLATLPAKITPNDVFFIWSGANDFIKLLPATPTDPFPSQLQLLKTADQAAQNIADDIALLSSRGARRFVVVTLPNIGITPAIRLLKIPEVSAGLQTVAFTFNSLLNQKMGAVIARYGVKVLYIDSYSLLDNIVKGIQRNAPNPYTVVVRGQKFQFSNYTAPACGFAGPAFIPAILCPSGSSALTQYVFADGLHPTNTSHHVLALTVENKIESWQ